MPAASPRRCRGRRGSGSGSPAGGAKAGGGAGVTGAGLACWGPRAGGATGQGAGARAVERGVSLGRVLPVVAAVRGRSEAAALVMSDLNPRRRRGSEAATRDLAKAGVGG